MRIAILAHDRFPDRAKTAIGVMRYSDHETVAVLDQSATEIEWPSSIDRVPVISSLSALDPDAADALVIGIAPIGGRLPSDWRGDITLALERGWDVISGLHTWIGEDDEFDSLAHANDVSIRDLRRPPKSLAVSEGRAGDVDASVILTVGTDCSVGKMTTTMELAAALEDRGHATAVVPTGQTAILIEGWGIAVDAVPSDFVAGAVESMVLEASESADYVLVEGQGSLTHPAYSAVTSGILHGAMPDKLVLCHAAGRSTIHGYDGFPLPPVEEYVDLYERVAAPVAQTMVVAGSLNTASLDSPEASAALEQFASSIGAPATDVLRDGAGPLAEAVV